MKFSLDGSYFTDIDAAESGCFLITNGLGGYSCLDLACGTSRNDHALFMAAVKAPNVRHNMITNVLTDIKLTKPHTLCPRSAPTTVHTLKAIRILKMYAMKTTAFP